jgi:predicted AAA+ superfamily ATPase
MTDSTWRSRWTAEQKRLLLLEQSDSFLQRDPGIPRSRLLELERAVDSPFAAVVSGLRRAGKSTLLAQLARQLPKDSFYYLNFQDDRFLEFRADDMDRLYQLLVEVFGERQIFILDEVQNVPAWERFVRRFMDQGFKFFITSSNASLLSRELGTLLTGRYIPIELFPFSFGEFLRFRQIEMPDLKRLKTKDIALLRRNLFQYLEQGGIPDVLRYPELPVAQTLYDDIIYRDVATRYRIQEVRVLKDLALFLMSNPARPVSFNKLKERMGLGSLNTAKAYLDFLEDGWLIFPVYLYDHSVRRQQLAPRKIYPIDTGLAAEVGFSVSPDLGRWMETAVFLALRRRSSAIYYYKTPEGYEVDLYLPAERRLIQVAQNMNQPETRRRELRALESAMRSLEIDAGLVLTEDGEDPVEKEGRRIEIRPVAAWLLENS